MAQETNSQSNRASKPASNAPRTQSSNNSTRPTRNPRPDFKRPFNSRRRKKVDFIAVNHIEYVDYKDSELLNRFTSERGKILPRRVTGTSAKNQRKVSEAIKRARIMGILPFIAED